MSKEPHKPTGGIILPDKPPAAAPRDLSEIRAESCGTCLCSYFPVDDQDTGNCRHSPPTTQILFLPSRVDRNTPVGEPFSAWPIVRRDQFCVTGFSPKKGSVQ